MKTINRPPAPSKFDQCPFCGGTPLTKTHIWPRWLNNLLPTAPRFYSHHSEASGIHLSSGGRVESTQTHKKDIFDQQPYIACYPCNGGWMKDFEDEVIRFVKPIILGTFRGRLTEDEQVTLAGWLSLIFILSELISFSQKTVTKADLEYLKNNRRPPETWTILAANQDGFNWMKRRQYHNVAIYDRSVFTDLPKISDGLPIFNTQIGTMGIGALLTQIFICPSRHLVEKYREENRSAGLKVLWPLTAYRRLKFPLTENYSDAWAERFAHDIFIRMKDFVHAPISQF